ncbi:membrane fusion protein (multidrug efflux system) [Paraburkholderia bannensis]|uniref:Membrane fusion protein (Multidrug efflux system) n=1 Tax=Paraburkholderia bannensis TaxID=765414 RepID=A0A7W9WSI7_9BURK|nr:MULTISPECIES: HlyD family efflux transporter periplasmic adaptor subunit [Paraburkholderia]MBB3259279.1 membrane fusion protein (multidrug efflux system) [Paraburkholderia sp. WP4_3_2]MBB6104295.1 membrane fusion protein (multidrug efflux system) [Paraburkholderia bannensis]
MSETITTDRAPAEQRDEQQRDEQHGGAQAATAHHDEQAAPPRRRKRLIALLGAVTLIAGAAYGAYYFTEGRFHESTDDAYVSGNLVQLTPQVTGTVVAVNADDTQIVREGEPVVTLDPADARIALANAEASLGQTVRRVSGLYVNNDFYAANVAQRESDLARANDDLHRRVAVADSGAVSAEDIAHARATVQAAQAALDAARQQGAANHALTDRTSVEQHPDVLAAASKVRAAWLDYARDTLPAPVTGYVAQRHVQVGERVSPGTPLMAIVPLNSVWVDANFKEVQLKHMRVGQPVTLTADVYGSGVKYHGRIEGFSAGTGSAFATLAAQNATGNWIKIVQRLPVRIALDPRELAARPLRIGLSMTVDADTRDDSGSQLGAAQNTRYRTNVFADYDAQADGVIEKIIKENEMAATALQASPQHVAARDHQGNAG